MNFCVPCRRGIHDGCKAVLLGNTEYCECTHDATPTPTPAKSLTEEADLASLFSTDEPDEIITVKGSRRHKPDSALKDQQSTGRKRAAKLYPLDREAPCEWAGLRGVGGGVTIDGCGIRLDNKGEPTPKGKQQSRHHGPDYNTLNNDSGNVHRICHSCHNAWHRVNDPHKDEQYLALYGMKPEMEDLSTAAKELRSGGPIERPIESTD